MHATPDAVAIQLHTMCYLISEVCTEGQLLLAVVQHCVFASPALGLIPRTGLHGCAEVGKSQYCHFACSPDNPEFCYFTNCLSLQ